MHETSTAGATDRKGSDGQGPGRTTLIPVSLLFALTILAQLVSLAFGRIDSEQRFAEILPVSLLYLSILTLPACYAGVVLGRQTGLGMTRLDDLLSGHPGAIQTLKGDVVLAAVLGFLTGGILLALRVWSAPFLPPELPQLGYRGVLGGFRYPWVLLSPRKSGFALV